MSWTAMRKARAPKGFGSTKLRLPLIDRLLSWAGMNTTGNPGHRPRASLASCQPLRFRKANLSHEKTYGTCILQVSQSLLVVTVSNNHVSSPSQNGAKRIS
jgi:hypothetical protein